MRVRNEANLVMEKHLRELGLNFEPEYKFCEQRDWRFDYCLEADTPNQPNDLIAIEIEGGIWTQGRHVRGQGFLDDLEKYNHAAIQGFIVLRFSTQQVLDGSAKEFLRDWLRK
jgi:hypothetical protein